MYFSEDTILLGKRLTYLRTFRQMTRKQVAEMIGVHVTAYGHWENGRNFPSKKYLNKLAELFDVNTDFLLGISETPTFYANSASKIKSSMILFKDEEDLIKKYRTLDSSLQVFVKETVAMYYNYTIGKR